MVAFGQPESTESRLTAFSAAKRLTALSAHIVGLARQAKEMASVGVGARDPGRLAVARNRADRSCLAIVERRPGQRKLVGILPAAHGWRRFVVRAERRPDHPAWAPLRRPGVVSKLALHIVAARLVDPIQDEIGLQRHGTVDVSRG